MSSQQPSQQQFELFTRGSNPERLGPALPSSSRTNGIKRAYERAKRSFDPHGGGPDAELRYLLEKGLSGYHSQWIALGSAIGAGLFIGSGAGLAIAGPIPLLGAFSYVGMTLCFTIFALGEMATYLPLPGGFFIHTIMFTDEAWGGAMGLK